MKQKIRLVISIKLLNCFGFTEIEADLSTRPNDSIGEDKDWENATKSLEEALNQQKISYKIAQGEGAFYGPKIDLHIKDAIGRRWQLTTIQIDFAQPNNFSLEYVNSDNKKVRPVMIHRALLGSIERFTGILIEHYAGEFPGWLAPNQINKVEPALFGWHGHKNPFEFNLNYLPSRGIEKMKIGSPSIISYASLERL